MARAIGIDLGTTNSVIATITAGEAEIIENAEGSKITPSVVAYDPDGGRRIVGDAARRQATMNPENTIYSAKRFIGRRFDDPAVQSDKDRVPFVVGELPNGDAGIRFEGELQWPEIISAAVLRKLKEDTEAELGEEVTQAVITVPAHFGDAQRKATRVAGEIAGFEVLQVVPEPTTAALAYGFGMAGDQTVAVFDLGGGTFDVTILQFGDGVFEVLSTAGDTHLGGDDFDARVLDWMLESFAAKDGSAASVLSDRATLSRLRAEAEHVKVDLSSQMSRDVDLPFLTADEHGPRHLRATLTRAEYEKLVEDLVAKTVEPTKDALEQAGKATTDLDAVLLVGGMTRTPIIQQHVEKLFGMKPNRSVNPDEIVAMGAALQAGVLQDTIRGIQLVNVTPLSLGSEIVGGIMVITVPRNTRIPTSKSRKSTTVNDGQTKIDYRIYQGERDMAEDNTLIGGFTFEGIMPAPRGVPSLELQFDVDADGILTVTATDLSTEKTAQATIRGRSGIPPEEVERRIRESEFHAEDDRVRRQAAELINDADQLVYDADKMLKFLDENEIKIADHERNTVLEKRREVESLKDQGKRNTSALRPAVDELRQLLMKIGEEYYRRTRTEAN